MTDKKKTTTKKVPSEQDWLKVGSAYIKDGLGTQALIKKFPKLALNANNIKNNMKRLGFDIARENVITETRERVTEEIVADNVAIVKRIVKIYQNTLDVAEDILKNYKDEQMLNPAKPRATAYNLDQLSGAINKCHNGLKIALNLDETENNDMTPKFNTVKGIDMEDI